MARLQLSGPAVGLQPVDPGTGRPAEVAAIGLARMGQQAGELADQQLLERARQERSLALTSLTQEMNDELEAIDQDPNRVDGLADHFEAKFSARANELMQGLTAGAEAQLQFRDSAMDLIGQGRLKTFDLQFRRQGERAKNQLNLELQEIRRNVLTVDNAAAIATLREKIAEAVNSYAAPMHLTDEQAELLEQAEVADAMTGLASKRLANNQPGLLLREMNAGVYGDLPADVQLQLYAQASAQLEQENAAAYEERIIQNPWGVSDDELRAASGAAPAEGGISETTRVNLLAQRDTYKVTLTNRQLKEERRTQMQARERALANIRKYPQNWNTELIYQLAEEGVIDVRDANILDAKLTVIREKEEAAEKRAVAEEGQLVGEIEGRAVERLKKRILAGDYPEETELNQLTGRPIQEGGLSQGSVNRLISFKREQQEKNREKIELLQLGTKIMDDRSFLYQPGDPKHRKAYDQEYRRRIEAAGVPEDPMNDDWSAYVLQLASTKAGVPTSVTRLLSATIDNGTTPAEKVARASELLHGIRIQSPSLFGQMSKENPRFTEVADYAESVRKLVKLAPRTADGLPDYGVAVAEARRQKLDAESNPMSEEQYQAHRKKVLGERTSAAYIREQLSNADLFDDIRMKEGTADLTGPFFGLGGAPTVWDAMNAVTEDGEERMPGPMLAQIEQSFDLALRTQKDPELALRSAVESTLGSGWGISKAQGLNPGRYHWEIDPIEEAGADLEDTAEDLAWMIAGHLDKLGEEVDIRRDPSLVERMEGMVRAMDLNKPYRDYWDAVGPGSGSTIEGKLSETRKLLTQIPGNYAQRALATAAAVATGAGGAALQDRRRFFEERARVWEQRRTGEPGLDLLTGLSEAWDTLHLFFTDQERRVAPPPATEVVARTYEPGPGGFFEAATGFAGGHVAFHVERHPLADVIGKKAYRVTYSDRFGNRHVVPESTGSGLEAVFVIDPEDGHHLRERAALKAEEVKAKRFVEGYEDLLEHPDSNLDAMFLDPKAGDRVAAEREVLRTMTGKDFLMPAEQTPLAIFRRMARDPYAAYAWLQLTQEIARAKQGTTNFSQLTDAKRELEKTFVRQPRRIP